MNTFKTFAVSALGAIIFLVPASYASAASVTIQSLMPGTSVMAKNSVSFSTVLSGFEYPVYQISDSFGTTSSISNENLNLAGSFRWTPGVLDVGTHTITVTVTDNSANRSTATQTITVLPPPAVIAQNISPGKVILPGAKLMFTTVATGFTNPTFIAGDYFGGSSVGNANIDAAGNFSWTPDVSQDGEHSITVYATDSLGHNASVSVPVQVGNGPTLTVTSVTPGSNVNPGQLITFMATPMSFLPTSFSLIDSMGTHSTVSNGNITTTGSFSWTPSGSDVGVHTLLVTGLVGAYGKSATTTVTLTVLGPNGAVPVSAPAPAASTSNPSLSSLQATLAQLQSQMHPTSVSTSTATIPRISHIFRKFIKRGRRGAEVLELQKKLVSLGYLNDEPSGFFGVATEKALKKFQSENKLDVFGYVGPGTRALLNK